MKRPRTYEELLQPPRWGSLDALYWRAFSRVARTLSPLSDGMSLGYRHGFDSGPMLDYVYENRAHGRFGLGRVLDRVYLNAIGWRGIRQRKRHLQELLREVIGTLRTEGRSIHIVDIAAGPGRYLLEILDELRPADDVHATLRDWDETGLAQGRRLAQAMGISSVRYERGDAFDPHDLARVSPKANVVVVSGLYELFADNERIRRSLSGVMSLLEPEGYFIYTNQPAHPQLELIARCLPNREGKPWVMRLRSQAEMDQLLAEAGLRHGKALVDRWGMYVVSVAIKPQ